MTRTAHGRRRCYSFIASGLILQTFQNQNHFTESKMSKSKSWFTARNAGSVGEIFLYSDRGEGGVSADSFYASLVAMRSVSTLVISINSNGGDVSTGFAIFNMLKRHPARKVVRVDGIAASMASVIAMVGDEVVMPSNAMLMIHNPYGAVGGSGDQIKSFGDALNVMQQNIAATYAQRTKIKIDRIFEMMDSETWLSADQALELGFADRVEAPLKMAALANGVDTSRFLKAPTRARGIAAIQSHIYEKFNRTTARTPGGAAVYVEKGGRRVLRET
jgi:ATP-dependent protease ClpP protease subunit